MFRRNVGNLLPSVEQFINQKNEFLYHTAVKPSNLAGELLQFEQNPLSSEIMTPNLNVSVQQ